MSIIHQIIERNQGYAITIAEIAVFTSLISLIIYHLMIYLGRKSFQEGKLYMYFSMLLSGFTLYIFLDTNMYFVMASLVLNTDVWTTFFTALSWSIIFFSFQKLMHILIPLDKTNYKKLQTGLLVYLLFSMIWLLPVIPQIRVYHNQVFYGLWAVTGFYILFQLAVCLKLLLQSQKKFDPEIRIIIWGVLAYIVYIWVYRIFLITNPTKLPLWIVNNFLKIAMAFTFALALARKFNREFVDLAALKENLELKVQETTSEILKAKEQIEEESRLRTNYFIQVAHETKTPLTLITNYLHRVEKLQGSSKELTVVKDNLHLLRETMVRFLDAEKFEKGTMVYNHATITNLSEAIKIKLPLYHDMAMQHNITLKSDITEDVCLECDPLAFERIINNLFDNALKFSSEGGTISISLNLSEGMANLRVTDTGKGIPKNELENIFQRFYQIPSTSKNSGLGMGLYIVKQTVDSLHGKVHVESKTGDGTSFIIQFPYKEMNPAKNVEVAFSFTRKSPALSPKHFPGRKNILVIEDNTDMRAYLAAELSEFYNIYQSRNGKEATELLKTSPSMHLILSDVMMDVMDGYEFYESLKNKGSFNIPFIFLTARSNSSEKIDYLNRGVADYIFKPFSLEELLAKINSVLKNTSEQRKAGLSDAIAAIHNHIAAPAKKVDKWEVFEKNVQRYELTERQIEVIKEIEKGDDYKQIADRLNISQKTVHRHVQILFEKFSVHTKIDLLKKLFEV